MSPDGNRREIKAIKTYEKTYSNSICLVAVSCGWGVDLGTNCVSKPSKTYFFIQERPSQTTNQAGMKPKETTVE